MAQAGKNKVPVGVASKMAATSRQPYDLNQGPGAPPNTRRVNGVGRSVSQRTQNPQNGKLVPRTYQNDLPYDSPGRAPPTVPPIDTRDPYIRDSVPPRSGGPRSFSERIKVSPLTPDLSAGKNDRQPVRQPFGQSPIGANQQYVNEENGFASSPGHYPQRGNTTREPANGRVPSGQNHARREPSVSQSTSVRRPAEALKTPVDSYSPVSPASTIRSPHQLDDDQRRDWATDRSPLQKLEVTLNDITKEEKRARVEEAEMLLREAKAGRGGRRASKEVGNSQKYTSRTAPQEPTNLEDVGLVRNLSTTHRDRLHHSATIPNQKPDVRRLSGNGRATFNYEERQPAEEPTDRQPAKQQPRDRHDVLMSRDTPVTKSTWKEMSQPHPAHTSHSTRRRLEDEPAIRRDPPQKPSEALVGRSKTTRQPTHAIPSNITRAVSLQHRQPEASFASDHDLPRNGPARESNSSHKALLSEGANIGVATAAGGGAGAAAGSLGRSNSKKLQKKGPASYPRQNEVEAEPSRTRKIPVEQSAYMAQRNLSNAGGYKDETHDVASDRGAETTPKHLDGQRKTSQSTAKPVGLGLHDVSPEEPPEENHHHHLSDLFHRKSNRHSVSFKEPFDRARPVNEWKNAGIARLTSADLDLTDNEINDKNKAWWEGGATGSRRKSRKSQAYPEPREATDGNGQTTFNPPLYLRCGPLLRYTGLKSVHHGPQGQSIAEKEMWRGSVMIVTQDTQSSYETIPVLRLFSQPKELLPPPPEQINGDEGPLAPEYVDPLAGLTKVSRTGQTLYVRPVDHLEEAQDLSTIENENGLFENSPSPIFSNGNGTPLMTSNKRTSGLDGEALGKWKEVQGARLYADPARDITFWRFNLEVELAERQQHIAYRINQGPAIGFWVPAKGRAMNIMFHSCNGFSLSVNSNDFSGPDPLWRDVLNTHQTRPFHVMIGGGDQIYNDRAMVQTKHFAEWTKLKNPHEKHHAIFTTEMEEELETFYLNRYAMWFSQGLFGMANSQIPMVNVWDDHDIIDGFGSYPDNFMRTPVFRGLGEIAFKYYMLFQHQSVPEELTEDEPSWLLGEAPGPYIQQQSRSVFMSMGRSVAFVGLDCRTERTVCEENIHRKRLLTTAPAK